MTSSTMTIKDTDVNSTALEDQVDAANKHVADAYERLSQRIQGYVTNGPLSPRMCLLAETLGQRLMEGRTVMCRHLTFTGPEPAFWIPSAPGLIRCRGCVKTVQLRIKGTAQDYSCDTCRRYSRPLYSHGFLIPAAVLDLPELPFTAASPAITVTYGTCLACRTK